MKNVQKYLVLDFNGFTMINNNIICIIFIPRVVYAWLHPKRSNIGSWVVKRVIVKDSNF